MSGSAEAEEQQGFVDGQQLRLGYNIGGRERRREGRKGKQAGKPAKNSQLQKRRHLPAARRRTILVLVGDEPGR